MLISSFHRSYRSHVNRSLTEDACSVCRLHSAVAGEGCDASLTHQLTDQLAPWLECHIEGVKYFRDVRYGTCCCCWFPLVMLFTAVAAATAVDFCCCCWLLQFLLIRVETKIFVFVFSRKFREKLFSLFAKKLTKSYENKESFREKWRSAATAVVFCCSCWLIRSCVCYCCWFAAVGCWCKCWLPLLLLLVSSLAVVYHCCCCYCCWFTLLLLFTAVAAATAVISAVAVD
jgi:hypothetical protein